jgi:hypothetical protein
MCIILKFDDGTEGEVDFSEFFSKGPVFLALKDKADFSKATVEGSTIAWPNGADIAPETLYEKFGFSGNFPNTSH